MIAGDLLVGADDCREAAPQNPDLYQSFPEPKSTTQGHFHLATSVPPCKATGQLFDRHCPAALYTALASRRLRFLATFPNWETIEQLTAYHPRYFLVPKIAMPLHGWLMFFGTMDLATFRRKKAVSEAAPVRGGRDGVAFAVQFCPAQFDQA